MNRYLVPLRAAFEEERLDAFLAEVKAKGIGSSDREELDRALVKVMKEQRSEQRKARIASRVRRLG